MASSPRLSTLRCLSLLPSLVALSLALQGCARSDADAAKGARVGGGEHAASGHAAHTCSPSATVCAMPADLAPGGERRAREGARVGGAPPGGVARRPSGMPRLVELEMPGCSACAKMEPVLRSIVARCSKGGDSPVERLDVTEADGEVLARRHAVKELPTFLALDAQGAEVMRLVGLQKPEALATLVAEVTGRACAAPEDGAKRL